MELSDEQLVDHIRSSQQRMRRRHKAAVIGCIFFGLLGMGFFGWFANDLHQQMTEIRARSPGQKPSDATIKRSSFILGGALGILAGMCGFGFVLAIFHACMLILRPGAWKDELILRLWDQIHSE
jgi:hypothetical protein